MSYVCIRGYVTKGYIHTYIALALKLLHILNSNVEGTNLHRFEFNNKWSLQLAYCLPGNPFVPYIHNGAE